MSDQDFLISRVFNASRELVWKAWMDPKHVTKWWGPKGFTMLKCTIDLRVGGIFHYGMKSPNGDVMWGKWTFGEIVKPERLGVTVAFSDEHAGILPQIARILPKFSGASRLTALFMIYRRGDVQ